MTFSLRGLAAACLLVASGLQPAAAQQAYPNRSIRAVLPYSAGSGPDAVLRCQAMWAKSPASRRACKW